MLPKVNPINTKAWEQLQIHYMMMQSETMKDLFAHDADRFSKFSILQNDILFDYSKNMITAETIRLLLQLTDECKLKESIDAG